MDGSDRTAARATGSATAVLPAPRPAGQKLPPAPWHQMPPVGSPDAPYPMLPAIALPDPSRAAQLERLRETVADLTRQLREAEALRDADAQRLRWFEQELTRAQQEVRQQQDQLQQMSAQIRVASLDAHRVHEAAVNQVAIAEQQVRDANDAAARYAAQADARWAVMGETLAQLEHSLAEAVAERDLARHDCAMLQAELDQLMSLPAATDELPADSPAAETGPVGALDWQSEALAAWVTAKHRGVIESVPGADRRGIARRAITEARADGLKAVVLVATAELAEVWHDDLCTALPDDRVGKYVGGALSSNQFDVLVATVDAAARQSVLRCDSDVLLVADEVDTFATAERAVAFDEAYARRLGLSSFYQRDDDGIATYLTRYFGDVVFRLGYERAFAESAVAGFDLALIEVSFTAEERAAYDEHDAQVRDSEPTTQAHLQGIARRAEVLSRAAAKDAVARTLIHFPGAAHALIFSAATIGNADLVGGRNGAEFAIALSASGSRREMAERLGRLTGSGPEEVRRRLVIVYVGDTAEDDRCDGNVTYLSDITPYASNVRRFDATMFDELADFLT
ncbi:MAG TPA: hypothetical protein VHB69_08545 [Mycobacteriales bacterium]|nr:hypothetical protein [Mycobacteriales bacterium]